jgi:hypothetical protein
MGLIIKELTFLAIISVNKFAYYRNNVLSLAYQFKTKDYAINDRGNTSH